MVDFAQRLRQLATHLKGWEDGETGEPTHDDQLCLSAADEIERLRSVIARIQRWEMPESGRFWKDGRPMSYGAAFGSNGERELVRHWAQSALNKTEGQK